MAIRAPAWCSPIAIDQAMLRLLATPKTTATRPSRLKDMKPPRIISKPNFVGTRAKGKRISAAPEETPVGRRLKSHRARRGGKTARSGRSAWGVLGSAAGGLACSADTNTPVLAEFRRTEK